MWQLWRRDVNAPKSKPTKATVSCDCWNILLPAVWCREFASVADAPQMICVKAKVWSRLSAEGQIHLSLDTNTDCLQTQESACDILSKLSSCVSHGCSATVAAEALDYRHPGNTNVKSVLCLSAGDGSIVATEQNETWKQIYLVCVLLVASAAATCCRFMH